MAKDITQSLDHATGEQTNTPMRERIVQAALQAFEESGIDKASIWEIARIANVSRPTVYRYFRKKIDIVEYISEIESVKIKSEVKRSLRQHDSFEESLIEALMIIIKTASGNAYIRHVMKSDEFFLRSIDVSGHYHEMQKIWWGNLLTDGLMSGAIASDLDLDEIVVWLTSNMRSLLERMAHSEFAGAEMRRVISRFIVRPILAPQ